MSLSHFDGDGGQTKGSVHERSPSSRRTDDPSRIPNPRAQCWSDLVLPDPPLVLYPFMLVGGLETDRADSTK